MKLVPCRSRYGSASLLKMPDKALDLFSPSERKLTDVMTSKRTESGKVILGYSGGILMQTEFRHTIGEARKRRKVFLKLHFSNKP
jgi:hypothetical protein